MSEDIKTGEKAVSREMDAAEVKQLCLLAAPQGQRFLGFTRKHEGPIPAGYARRRGEMAVFGNNTMMRPDTVLRRAKERLERDEVMKRSKAAVDRREKEARLKRFQRLIAKRRRKWRHAGPLDAATA